MSMNCGNDQNCFGPFAAQMDKPGQFCPGYFLGSSVYVDDNAALDLTFQNIRTQLR